ncbi:MAG: KOW domain-containing RNA-binding protein [Bacillota bacterium]|nr:KOW domain-containing RNA-binding protein [Bacillota bacterium]
MEGRKLRMGQVVRSCAGRDSDCFYVVVGIVSEDRVALADGIRRKIDNPKTKNIKHVKIISHADESLKRRLAGGEKISDADVRKVLRGFVEEEGC